ncbi:MAG: methyltransferase [Pseudomonadota bacterium]
MKRFIKNTLARAANTGWLWPVFSFLRKIQRKLGALCTYVERQRRTGVSEDLKSKILREQFQDLTVKNGIFAGLKYPDAEATGSALLPKLLGSYEVEVEPFFHKARTKTYGHIIDIGCAEGYYAVGLARVFPDARVHAYDVDAGARAMCQRMAAANGIGERLSMGAFCEPKTLKEMALDAPALIVSDCEGYEEVLFDREMAVHLTMHDIVIECHDYKAPGMSDRIAASFSETHDVSEVISTPDYLKAHDLELPQMAPYNAEIRTFMVEESRGFPQKWLFLEARPQPN